MYSIKSFKAGRAGSPMNYCLSDRVMPPPPPHAKATHDAVLIGSTADPLGKLPTKWNPNTSSEAFKKFSRHNSHLLLNNVCTMEQFMNNPDLKCLECWYCPRPKSPAKPEIPAKFFKCLKPEKLTARPDEWGAWNVSVEPETLKKRRHDLRRSTTDSSQNSIQYSEKHVDKLNALRELQRAGWRPRHKVNTTDHLKKRREDVRAVLNLP